MWNPPRLQCIWSSYTIYWLEASVSRSVSGHGVILIAYWGYDVSTSGRLPPNDLDISAISCFYVIFHFYRPQRSWAKVIFSEACVKNSVHRGRVYLVPGVHLVPRGPGPGAWVGKGGTPPPKFKKKIFFWFLLSLGILPLGSRVKHIVNERPVGIVLECILVFFFSGSQTRWKLVSAEDGISE